MLKTVKALKCNGALVEIKLGHEHSVKKNSINSNIFEKALVAVLLLEMKVGKVVLESYYANHEFQVALLQVTRSHMKPIMHVQLSSTSRIVLVQAVFSAMEKSSRINGQGSVTRLSTYWLPSARRGYLRKHVVTLAGHGDWYYSFN